DLDREALQRRADVRAARDIGQIARAVDGSLALVDRAHDEARDRLAVAARGDVDQVIDDEAQLEIVRTGLDVRRADVLPTARRAGPYARSAAFRDRFVGEAHVGPSDQHARAGDRTAVRVLDAAAHDAGRREHEIAELSGRPARDVRFDEQRREPLRLDAQHAILARLVEFALEPHLAVGVRELRSRIFGAMVDERAAADRTRVAVDDARFEPRELRDFGRGR